MGSRFLVVLLTCGLLLAACTDNVGGSRSTPTAAATPAPTPTQVASVTPCGDIVIAGVLYGGYRLYCTMGEGDHPEVLTSERYEWEFPYPTYERDPMWSPDGSRLLFISDERAGLYTVNAAGSDLRAIAMGDIATAVWSPDGSRIALVRITGSDNAMSSEIAIADREGQALQSYIRSDTWVRALAWSPDGQRLAYGVRRPAGGFDAIHAIDVSSGADVVLAATGSGGSLRMGVWSRSGAVFYFAQSGARGGSGFVSDVHFVTHDGRFSGLVRADVGRSVFDFALSPSGDWLAFVDGESYKVYLLRTDGAELRPLRTGIDDEYGPIWTPNGIGVLVWRVTGHVWKDFLPDVVADLELVTVDGRQTTTIVRDVEGWNELPSAALRPEQ